MDASALGAYMPASVLHTVATDADSINTIPYSRSWDTCALFADISGYTKLCEAMAAKGPTGDEHLAKHLNSYFELLVRTLSSNGGDVFKFAGDAVLALWPPSDEDLQTKVRRAAQCGLEIKSRLQQIQLSDDIVLSVTVGIGAGKVSLVHVGGVFDRLEYLPVGEPLVQAYQAEHEASPPDIVISEEAWILIKEFFEAKPISNKSKMMVLNKCLQPIRKVSVFKTIRTKALLNSDKVVLKALKSFIPSAVIPYVTQKNSEKWASELRRITVLFVNLGIGDRLIRMQTEQDKLMIHTVVSSVQRAVYRYEGSLNKFLMDDKGSTLVAAFGLPPLAHEDDAVRAVLSSLAICAQLHALGIAPSIGITTGTAFCGVVGSHGRREYTVLGDTVNLSARLMQAATKANGGIFCDMPTQYACRGRLIFERLPSIRVKGKKDTIKIFNPYPKELASMFTGKAVIEKFRKITRAISVDQSEEDRRARKLGARRKTIEMGTSLLQNKKGRRRFQSIISIFDTFFNPDDQDREFGGVEVTAERVERGVLGKTGRRTILPNARVNSILKLDAPIVEEFSVDDLEKEIETVRKQEADTTTEKQRQDIDRTLKTPKNEALPMDDPKNLMNQLHAFQREGYMQQNTLKKHVGKHKAQQRKSGFLKTPRQNGDVSNRSSLKDDLINTVVTQQERRSLSTNINSNDIEDDSNNNENNNISDKNVNNNEENKNNDNILNETITNSNQNSNQNHNDINNDNTNTNNNEIKLPPLFNGSSDSKLNSANNNMNELKDVDEEYQSVVINDEAETLYASAPVKAVRVLLPNEKGHITITAYDLKNVKQLKKRVMDRCRVRKFVPEDCDNDEYCFLFTSTNIGLSDHLDLITVPSILSTHNIPNQSVVELSLVPLRVAAGNWYGSYVPSRSGSLISHRSNSAVSNISGTTKDGDDFSDEELDDIYEPTQVRPNIIRMFTQKRISYDENEVVDDAIACDQTMRQYINTLVQKQIGGTLIIEGEVGVGKSYLLSNTILSAPGYISVCCTVANPFEMSKPLSVFGDLLLQLLDDEFVKQNINVPDPLSRRMEYIAVTLRTILESENINENDVELWNIIMEDVSNRSDLLIYLPVLNELLRLEFPPVLAATALDQEAKVKRIISIFLVLISYIAKQRSIAFVIDDALYMDEFSWQFCKILNEVIVPNNLLLVVSTRPINRSYMAAFGKVPPEYTDILNSSNTRRLELQPRPDEIIYQMACDALEVAQLPPLLAALVLQKSHGNPLVVKEFVYALEHNGLVTVDKTTGTCLLSKTIQFMDLNELISTVHVPVPMTLEAVLGSQLDRLSHTQRMILKVACIIGDEFEFDLLHAAYPFKNGHEPVSKDIFAADIYRLLDMNIIRRVIQRKPHERRLGKQSSKLKVEEQPLNNDGDESVYSLEDFSRTKSPDEVKKQVEKIMKNEAPFAFTNGFMRDMLTSRLLEDQKSMLLKLVSKAIHSKLRDKSSILYLSQICSKTGWIYFCRNNEKLEKKYAILTDKAFIIYNNEEEYSEDPKERKKPLYLLVLGGARLSRSDEKRDKIQHVAEIRVFRWIEYLDGKTEGCNFDEEVFYLGSNENPELRTWLREIQRVIIQQMSSQRRSLMQLARKTKVWHRQRTAMGLAMGIPNDELKLEDYDKNEIAERFWQSVVSVENNKQGGGLLMNQVYVRKRKFFLTEWKQRWITLTPDGLFIRTSQLPQFNNKKITTKKQSLKPSFTDAIALTTGGCTVNLEGYDENKKVWMFRVHCEIWMKRLTSYEWKARDYFIGVSSEGAAQRWVDSIVKVIDFHRVTLMAAQRARKSGLQSGSLPNMRNSQKVAGIADLIARSNTTRF